jgi:hypothetical protein
MGRVIDMQAWRERRGAARRPSRSQAEGPLRRVETAVTKLERAMRRGTGRLGSKVESELLGITGDVAAGRMDEAARRAERLADLLEHPSSRLAT